MRRRHGENWAPARVARLQQLVADGVRFVAIGADVGVTKNAAIGKALRMGFKRSAEAVLTGRQLSRRMAAEMRRQRTQPPQPERATMSRDFPPAGFCVWPHGHPRHDDGFHFCGAPVSAAAAPYCPAHMARAHVKPSKPEDVKPIDWHTSETRGGRKAA